MKNCDLKQSRRFLIYSLVSMLVLIQFADADSIITDGSMGKIQHLSGQMVIPETLGTLKGNNLFHSFRAFNIAEGETATFTGRDSISNVISRVTGGNFSMINGLLKSEVGHANFYFINPAGVTFGAKAQVDVPAAFHLSTADTLRFTDGTQFSATDSSASVLTVAEPVSFGFLGHRVANIAVQGSKLRFKEGSTVTLSGSNITIDSGRLASKGGDIQLYAIGSSAAEITLNQLISDALSGKLSITGVANHKSKVDVSGNGAGKLIIRSGAVEIVNSYLFADNTGSSNASSEKGIDVMANNMMINNSVASVDALFKGDAANIAINLSGQLKIISEGDDSLVGSTTYHLGNAGKVTINSGSILTDGKNSSGVVGIVSDADVDSRGGNANAVNITSNNLTINNGGVIRSSSWSSGNAGVVKVDAKEITLDGTVDNEGTPVTNELNSFASQISSDNVLQFNAKPGVVKIKSDSLKLLNGGIISSLNNGKKQGGMIKITANNMTIDGKDNINFTGVSTSVQAVGKGSSGDIKVKVDKNLTIQHGGQISSSTYGKGKAGDVNVSANNLTIDRLGSDLLTGITSTSLTRGTKNTNNGGNVLVRVADKLSLLGGGVISTSTLSDLGSAGNIDVKAGNLWIDGAGGGTDSIFLLVKKHNSDGSIFFENQKFLLPRPILPGISSDNFFSTGQGGTVDVTVHNTLNMINNGIISSDTFGAGKAGDVIVNADNLLLNNAEISALAGANSAGQTGDITVTANKTLSMTQQAKISIQNDATQVPNAAMVKAGVIQVSAPDMELKNSTITAASTGEVNAGEVIIHTAHWLTMDSSLINTVAAGGNGGKVAIHGGELIALKNAGFLTSVTGISGKGGNINVVANNLVMNTGVIQANAVQGTGGDIYLNLNALIPSYDKLIKGGAQVQWQPGVAGFNVIQAATLGGVNGEINLTSPQFNISGSISGLNAHPLALPKIDHNACHNLSYLNSSLVHSGKGGMPASEVRAGFIPPMNESVNETGIEKQNESSMAKPINSIQFCSADFK